MRLLTLPVILVLALFTLASSPARQLDRSRKPEGKPAPRISLPDIQKTKLPNGLNVWLVEHHELPTVAFNLVIQAGADHDPIGMPGLATMTADLLDEGTTTRDALAISEEIESIGASFSTSANVDGSYLTMNTLKKHLDRALGVYADVLLHPVFAEKDVERIRKQRRTQLIQQKDQPVTIANNAFAAILYGPNHPYGQNPAGTESSLAAMTGADLKKFYSAYYRPGNATLIVVGDVTMGELSGPLTGLFAEWKGGDVASMAVPPPPPVETRNVYLIDKPGAPQSEVRIGYPALARSTPDFFPVTLMNRMLGGQFTSRINLNLREKHGFTYGARSTFNFQKGAGPFTAQGGIVTEKTDSALREFLFEIGRMKDEGMTPKELEFVKKGSIGSFALAFETPAQIAGALQNVVLYGLPDDYYKTYLQHIESVKLEDIQRVARQYLDPSKMAVVVVGDLARIRASVVALGLGRSILCTVEGKPIP